MAGVSEADADAGSVRALKLSEAGAFPNNPRLPMLIYAGAFLPATSGESLAAQIEARFSKNGWPPAWRYGVYPFQHYHAQAHEVLGVFSGNAELQFGGPEGPVITVEAGDTFCCRPVLRTRRFLRAPIFK